MGFLTSRLIISSEDKNDVSESNSSEEKTKPKLEDRGKAKQKSEDNSVDKVNGNGSDSANCYWYEFHFVYLIMMKFSVSDETFQLTNNFIFSGKDRNLNIAELLCASCARWFHESCIGYQLGNIVPFMMNYVFMCKNCSPTGLENFKKNQARKYVFLELSLIIFLQKKNLFDFWRTNGSELCK